MSANQWVAAALSLIVFIVFLFDLFSVAARDELATVSAVVLEVSRKHPMVPLLFGVLMGHLFWPQR